MQMHEAFVLDTSVFTNPDAYTAFGEGPELAVASFVVLARGARCRCYMPSSVYAELVRMHPLGDLAAEFELSVRVRSPRRDAIQIPASLLYAFIDEVRKRIDRGLRIAEEHARKGASGESIDSVIRGLRERYREALRRGIIDSTEDADVLLLAYELDAAIVSADQGLCAWADRAGVPTMAPARFREVLEHLQEGG